MRRWWAALVLTWLVGLGAARADEPPLQRLAREHTRPGQGVFVDADDGTVLVAESADLPVHPASVTKVATSLALLERLGPDHRFATRVLATGPVRDGRLAGDLVVEGGDDPFFVFESAFLVLRRLRELGLRRVDGSLVVRGPLLFNWQPDPDGKRLPAPDRATVATSSGGAKAVL